MGRYLLDTHTALWFFNPIETEYLTAFEGLPLIHRDPFDRLLIATAQVERLTLITIDENIARYDVSHIW